ncbi:MAG: hypothetical protein ACLTBR_03550 [Anaerostipes sp.]|uniref:hypothetical protein n=1 Tax=Anaerostipes sp. TaxID=1872530 RepID=UPI0039968D15
MDKICVFNPVATAVLPCAAIIALKPLALASPCFAAFPYASIWLFNFVNPAEAFSTDSPLFNRVVNVLKSVCWAELNVSNVIGDCLSFQLFLIELRKLLLFNPILLFPLSPVFASKIEQ